MKFRLRHFSYLITLTLMAWLGLRAVAQQESHPTGQQSESDIQAWHHIMERADDAMSIEDYVTAERLYRESLANAELHHLGVLVVAESNKALGRTLRAEKRYSEAQIVYQSALDLHRNVYEETNDSVLEDKVGLGIALVGLGKYGEAENTLLQSLDAYNDKPEVTACQLSFPLDALTMLYKSTHEYKKGERIYTEAFALMTGKRGTPCENFLTLLSHLAELYADDNQWDFVEKIHRGRADLAFSMKGSHSELYGDALFALGAALESRHHSEQAAAEYGKAAEVYRHTNPPALSAVALSLERQELSLYSAGKAEQAKQVHQLMLAASEQSQTKDLRGQMMAARGSGIEALKNGNLEEAGQFISREMTISQLLPAADQMIAFSDSAYLREANHQIPEAEADHKQVLSLAIASTGPTSTQTADAHFDLGWFYGLNQRLADAEQSFTSALALYGAHETEKVQRTLWLLGNTYVKDQKYDLAEPILLRRIKLAEDTHDNMQLCQALTELAGVYRKTNRFSDAEPLLTRALNVADHLEKPMNRQWAGVAMEQAALYEESGRAQQAEQAYFRIIAFVEQEFGGDSPFARLPLDKLISLLKSQGRLSEATRYEARRNELPELPRMPGSEN